MKIWFPSQTKYCLYVPVCSFSESEWDVNIFCPFGPVSSLTEVFVMSFAFAFTPPPVSNCLIVWLFLLRSPPPRILEEQAIREYVLALFRLPRSENLYEVASCSVWTPHARCHTAGTLYTTDSYLCFSSREEGNLILLIPLSEVQYLPFSTLLELLHTSLPDIYNCGLQMALIKYKSSS